MKRSNASCVNTGDVVCMIKISYYNFVHTPVDYEYWKTIIMHHVWYMIFYTHCEHESLRSRFERKSGR